ncbi:MAG: hypothetical protein ACE15B_01150 [Bryobacteraceae bacterium]
MILLLAAAAAAADAPRLHYTKSFPGSTPAWVGISVDRAGAGLYKETPDDDNPLKFQLSTAEADEIFGLVAKLDHFSRPLESPVKVAFMGMKTFRLESPERTGEVKFNFSADPDARLLCDWFERITESEQHFINLERTVKYDKLGVLKALLLLESALDRKRVVAPSQYLPLLDRVIKNETFMHTARVRAAGIAETIRAAGK